LENQVSEPVLNDDFIPGPPSGKTLKNKKSGFLRIFNRDKDVQSIPPVPSLPDGISQLQQSQRLTTASVHRVPVPSLSQPGVSIGQNNGSLLQATTKNVKRSSPSLSINTTTQGSPARATSSSRSHTLEVPYAGPQSAPAEVPEFPILKLRPVSTLFSASFGDLVPSDPSETAGQETPRSSTPPLSRSALTTPTSPYRTLDDFTSFVNPENHLAVKPQEQMLSAKNAWQRHIWELEAQVRDLKAELEQLKNNDEYCNKCGRGKKPPAGTIDRPRTRTGASSRFVNPQT
jgi:hypothetical protein